VHVLVLAASVALADVTPTDALVARAGEAEAEMRFADAQVAYASAGAGDSNRVAREAAARAAWLAAHAEGDFAPLRALERVRRSPALASDPQAVEALARAADTFPAGPVRVEARMLAGQAFVGRIPRHARGRQLLRQVVGDAHAEREVQAHALDTLIRSSVADGELDEGRADAARWSDLVPREAGDLLAGRLRRRAARFAALASIALVALGAVRALARAARARSTSRERARRAAPRAPRVGATVGAYAGVVAAGGGLAAIHSGEVAAATLFLALAAGLVPLLLTARAWSAQGGGGTRARVGRAMACGAGALAVAFLVLERVDPSYLEGFGL